MIRIGFIAALVATLALASPVVASAPSACGDKTAAPSKTVPATASKVVIPVQGMTCGGCANKLRNALMGLTGVYDAAIDYEKGSALVSYDAQQVTTAALTDLIDKAGYKSGTPAQPGA